MKLLLERLFMLATYQISSSTHLFRMLSMFPWMLTWPRPGRSDREEGKPEYDVILTCNYSPWSRYSGAGQKSVHMLAEEMSEQGLRTAVVYSKAPWERIAPHADTDYDTHWTGFFALRPGIGSPLRFLNSILFYFKVRSLACERTVLHGNGDEASLLWLVRRKRKFIYTNRYPEFPAFLRDRDWTRVATWFKILFREPRFIAMAMGLHGADNVTATSLYSLEEVQKAFGLDGSNASLVADGVDPVFLDFPMELENGSGVLFFGPLTPAKGADLALEAYARLPDAIRAAHPLRFIGTGPLRADLEARAKALGLYAEFLGWKSGAELAELIVSSGAVCLPSREESLATSVVETLALGQSLIATRAGSIPEAAGPCGSLVDSDPLALAARLEVALRNEKPWMDRCRQREFVRGRYSWGRTSLRFRTLYAQAVAGAERWSGHSLRVG